MVGKFRLNPPAGWPGCEPADEVLSAFYCRSRYAVGPRYTIRFENAHDAHAANEQGEIAIRLIVESDDRGELFVANKGRAFTASNLEAIRNIGTSDKEIGEGIGNKGLGFRSVEALTDDVRIYSAAGSGPRRRFDGYCFRFATLKEIETGLIGLGAPSEMCNEVAANIPRYLVPMPALIQSEQVRRLAQEGFATVVSLSLTSAEAIDMARRQVVAVIDSTVPVLLFLERVAALDVEIIAAAEPPMRRRLTRTIHPIETGSLVRNPPAWAAVKPRAYDARGPAPSSTAGGRRQSRRRSSPSRAQEAGDRAKWRPAR